MHASEFMEEAYIPPSLRAKRPRQAKQPQAEPQHEPSQAELNRQTFQGPAIDTTNQNLMGSGGGLNVPPAAALT